MFTQVLSFFLATAQLLLGTDLRWLRFVGFDPTAFGACR
jgi:hypothetical protein